ncbi:putative F-box protein At3g16210 [Salvia splendens]|uniref:putative F-box protein At3g16210 n=1 Tax=Salvia splendens TaxID=180675 RepID=UPI001C2751B8|nr:putative F-box protein At3g16210 [Salvia splendens]
MMILEGDSGCGIMNKIAKKGRLSARKETKLRDVLFANLPEEITIEILRRLTIRHVMTCKCVLRKSWRDLIEGEDFGMSYTPKPGLFFVYGDMEMQYVVCDEALKPLFRFGSPSHNQFSTAHYRVIVASANGFLSIWDQRDNILFICNPMTREHVELPRLSKYNKVCSFWGFGVSKTSSQYKIVYVDKDSCWVYTLGTGLWRSIEAIDPCIFLLGFDSAAFLNGNLHWLTYDSKENIFICCFDLETDIFTRFSLPCEFSDDISSYKRIYIFEGRLYLCGILDWCRVVLRMMNSYGDDNSWIKEYSFDIPGVYSRMRGLKVLVNGELLIAIPGLYMCTTHDRLFFIDPKNTEAPVAYKTYGDLEQNYSSNIATYTPSLISLTTIGCHNVQPLNFLYY